MITDEQYKKGGYGKHNLKKEYVEHVHSRATDSKGRVWSGEAGKNLQRRKQSKANYKRPVELTWYKLK